MLASRTATKCEISRFCYMTSAANLGKRKYIQTTHHTNEHNSFTSEDFNMMSVNMQREYLSADGFGSSHKAQ